MSAFPPKVGHSHPFIVLAGKANLGCLLKPQPSISCSLLLSPSTQILIRGKHEASLGLSAPELHHGQVGGGELMGA